MKNIKKTLITILFSFTLSLAIYAQPGSDGFEDEPEDVPLDGGILLLTAAGAVYGWKIIKNHKNK